MKTITALIGAMTLVAACDQQPQATMATADKPAVAAVLITSPVVGMWSPMLSGSSIAIRADGSFQGTAIGTFTVNDSARTIDVTAGGTTVRYSYAYPGYCGVDTHGQVLPEHCLVLTDSVGNTGTYEKL